MGLGLRASPWPRLRRPAGLRLDGSIPARRRLPGLPGSGVRGGGAGPGCCCWPRSGGRNGLRRPGTQACASSSPGAGAPCCSRRSRGSGQRSRFSIFPHSLQYCRSRSLGLGSPARFSLSLAMAATAAAGGGGRAGGVAAGRPSLGPGSGRSGRPLLRPAPAAPRRRRPAPCALGPAALVLRSRGAAPAAASAPSPPPRAGGSAACAADGDHRSGTRARRARPAAASAFRAAGPGPRSSAGAGATRSARSASHHGSAPTRAGGGAGQGEEAEGRRCAFAPGPGRLARLPRSRTRPAGPQSRALRRPPPASPTPPQAGLGRGAVARERRKGGAALPPQGPRPARCLHLPGRARPRSRRGATALTWLLFVWDQLRVPGALQTRLQGGCCHRRVGSEETEIQRSKETCPRSRRTETESRNQIL